MFGPPSSARYKSTVRYTGGFFCYVKYNNDIIGIFTMYATYFLALDELVVQGRLPLEALQSCWHQKYQ